MRRWWAATEGIRLIMLCFLIMCVGLTYIVGCGASSSEVVEEGDEVSWEQEYAENGEYYGHEAARVANQLCEDDQGVRQVAMNEEDYGLELVVCEDGEVKAP